MKIGFFDSGIGGLSVMHLALKYLPEADFIFYADREHVPYGEKKKEQIVEYVDEAVSFMIEKGADVIVIACNTATSAAIDIIRSRYDIPVIGMEPAVKKAVDELAHKRILVAATPVTVRGEKLKQLVEKVEAQELVELLPLPELVTYAEQGEFSTDHVVSLLQNKLQGLKLEEFSTLVLGCTHFNYFKDSFRKLLPQDMKIIDGNEGTINRLLCRISNCKGENERHSIEYFFSGRKATRPELLRIHDNLARLDQMYGIS